MNQATPQNNNTSFNQPSTVSANPEVRVVSGGPPLTVNKSKYRDEDDYDDRRRGRGPGCGGIGCGCRAISCGMLFLIILLIIGAAFIVVNKPSGIWSSVVTFLNADIKLPEFNGRTSDSVQADINAQITTVGENHVIIDQDSFTAIARERIPDLKNARVKIEPEFIKVYWELDQTVRSNPLYGIMEIKLENDNLKISKVGVQRIGSPEFLNEFVSNTALSLIVKDKNQSGGPYSLLYNFLSPDNNITISDLVLEEGKAIVTIDIKANLF